VRCATKRGEILRKGRIGGLVAIAGVPGRVL